MNPVQRIVKNIGMSGISQIAVSFFSFILLIYLARYLGEAEFGLYSFALSFTMLFIIFADMGISQFLIRELARDKSLTSKYLMNSSIIKIFLSFSTFGLIVLIINLMNYPPNVKYIVYLFGIYTILTSFAQMFMSIFQAFEKMEYVATITTIEKIIIISLGLYIIFSGYGLTELAYAYVFAGIVDLIISFILVSVKIEKPISKIDFSLWKYLTIKSIPFGLNGIFAALFFKIDTVLLSFMKNNSAAGIYNAAYNPILSLGVIMSTMVTSAIYPVMSRNFISSKDSLKNFTVLTSKYMAIIGFPMALGCFILADRFINLFYAGQYSESIIPFQILALVIPLRLVSSITGTLLSAINKQELRTWSVLLSAILNIILNLLLIPSLSYVGASIATVLSEIFLYGVSIYFIKKYFCSLNLLNQYLKPALASLGMGTILCVLKDFNLLLLVFLGIISYFTILLLLKTFNQQDKYLLKQILNR